jgi:hypothetical protein
MMGIQTAVLVVVAVAAFEGVAPAVLDTAVTAVVLPVEGSADAAVTAAAATVAAVTTAVAAWTAET